jgi:hypothetical protein
MLRLSLKEMQSKYAPFVITDPFIKVVVTLKY